MMDAPNSLNPTEGHILAGVKTDQDRFLARVKAPQPFQIAPDPRDSGDKRKLAASKEAQDMRSVRDAVQRLFEGAKAKNVAAYADYIAGVHNGRPGITPAIIRYSEDPLDAALDVSGRHEVVQSQCLWRVGLCAGGSLAGGAALTSGAGQADGRNTVVSGAGAW